jgi:Mg-chelatase subunit ChlD
LRLLRSLTLGYYLPPLRGFSTEGDVFYNAIATLRYEEFLRRLFMNPDFPQDERAMLEAKLTALLLGELHADEIAALSEAMENDPELAHLYERLKVTIELVREGAVNPAGQAASLKLSGERREKLLAQFKTVTPKEFAKPRRSMDWLAPWAAAAVVAIFFGYIAIPNFAKSRTTGKKNSIVNNLRLLDGAKQQWAIENHKSGDAEPTLADLGPYLGRDGRDVKLGSIAGETYVPGKLSEAPKVEANVREAKKLFGPAMVADAEVHNGKVLVSPLEDMPGIASTPPVQGLQTLSFVPQRHSRFAPVGPAEMTVPSGGAEAEVDRTFAQNTQIVLPGQTVDAGAGPPQTLVWAANAGSTKDVNLSHVSGAVKGEAGKQTNAFTFSVNSYGPTPASDRFKSDITAAGTVFVTNGAKSPLGTEVAKNSWTITTKNKVGAPTDNVSMVSVEGLRYSLTNGAFASQPVRWYTTDGTNNSAVMLADNGIQNEPAIAGTSTFGDSASHAGGTIPPPAIPAAPRRPSNTNWYAASASVRGFYEDAVKNSAITASQKSAPYIAAKEQLDEAKKWREIIAMKQSQESVDVELLRARMVSVLDLAKASSSEKPGLGQKIKEAFSGKVERMATIQVEQEHPDIGGLAGYPVAQNYDPYFLQTEFETIRSEAVLKRVVEKLKLDGGDKSKTEAAIKQLRKKLDLSEIGNTKSIAIGARSEKAEDAARIANAVAQAYRDFRAEEFDELKNGGINSLQKQLQEQDQKIATLQSNVDKLRGELKIPDAVANSSSEIMTPDRLKELSSLRASKEAEYNQEAMLLEGLKKLDRNGLRKALPRAYPDTQLNSLMQELDLAEQTLIKLEVNSSTDDRKSKNAQASVDDLNRKIDDQIQGVMTGLQSRVDSLKAFLDTLAAQVNQAQKADAEESKLYAGLNAELGKRAVDTALPQPAIPPPTPQPEILTRENAVSTFSLNVSDVSFKLAAASLEKGQMPEPASIRSEEFINAFDYRDPEARDGAAIAFASERARYPFAQNRELLRFSLKTAAAGRQAGRPLNIVLLLDNSGSMERADRVKIIQEALRVLAGQLQASDTFSVVTFARTAQLRVDGIPGNQAAAAAAEIAKLTPEGGTNLGDALALAYETARHHYLANGDNRVVLLTDGAANLGEVQADTLKQKVVAQRQQGIALDCFGIGWEGYNDDLLEVLTHNGDGRYGFINTPEEASTGFAAQIAGALHVAASDVKVQVEFNPKRVTSYRQIGYAKHQLTKEQFRDNTVDAAEIAAQEAGNALYTIEVKADGEGSIATVRVRYKVPGTAEYREQAWDVPYTGGAVALDQASPAMRLAATASAFSEWLSTSPFAAEVSPDQLLRYLSGVPQVYGADTRPAKLEWMIRQARSISGK